MKTRQKKFKLSVFSNNVIVFMENFRAKHIHNFRTNFYLFSPYQIAYLSLPNAHKLSFMLSFLLSIDILYFVTIAHGADPFQLQGHFKDEIFVVNPTLSKSQSLPTSHSFFKDDCEC